MIGLLVAVRIVPGVSLSVLGFIVAVVVFAVTQAILSLSILKLPHGYASLLLGGTGLALTIVALMLASVLTHGLLSTGWHLAGHDGCGVARDNDWRDYAARVAHPRQGRLNLTEYTSALTGVRRWSASRFCISPGPAQLVKDASMSMQRLDGG